MRTNLRALLPSLCGLAMLMGLQIGQAAPTPEIEVLGVSPRHVSESPSDIYDEPSSGLPVVATGQKVYLEALLEEEGASPYTAYEWAILSKPNGSNVALSAAEGEIVTLRPDLVGDYRIQLTPMIGNTVGTQTVELIRAGKWAGANVFNTHSTPKPVAPNCGTSFCHGANSGTPRLQIVDAWKTSNHAQKLQNHFSGKRGSFYNPSCLACHSVGFNASPLAVNGGFDDVASQIGFVLSDVTPLVADAYNNQVDNFPKLPAELQSLASVQCENCHGPGSQHPSQLQQTDHGIAGVNLDAKQCGQCHDSSKGIKFYQWSSSTHPVTEDIEEGRVSLNTSCVKCHTGEGFIQVRVNKQPPTLVAKPHGVTCSVCHDPHNSSFENQLRLSGDFTFDSGNVYTGAGKGGLCMNCHSGRVTSVATSINSSRGAHYGVQGDMLLGINGAPFNLAFNGNSRHTTVVADTCVACHMAEGASVDTNTPPTVGGHTYRMRDDKGTTDEADDVTNVTNACVACHSTLTTYNRTARGDYDGDTVVEGIQDEVRGLLSILRTGILAKFPGTTINDKGFISITTAGFAKLNTDQRSALYNYNYVMKDGSYGVHNTAYAVQLLQRAYYGIYFRSILDDYPKMATRGPVQPKTSAPKWEGYM